MASVRFLRAELSYGCHHGSFELPDKPEPVVVSGPNGAGKSTLVEGLVRTLFGFNRRSQDEAKMFETRRPWRGEAYSGRVEIADEEGRRSAVEREFGSTDVLIERLGPTGGLWRGDGNPAATNTSAGQFRDLLRELVGFDRLEGYERTAYVRQGGLLATRLDRDLLRAAAGSRIDVERALKQIELGHRRLTREAIVGGTSPAHKNRRREVLQQRIRDLGEQLQSIRQAQQVRAPLLEERDGLQRELERLTREVDALETAQLVLARRQALVAEIEGLEERIVRLERRVSEIERARSDARAAGERLDELSGGPELPVDFPERAAALEQLWESRKRTEQRADRARRGLAMAGVPHVAWTLCGLVVAAVGAAAWLAAGQRAAGLAGVISGIVMAAIAYGVRRARIARRRDRARAQASVEQELDELASAIASRLDSVPNADELTPATLPERREAFRRRQAAGVSAAWAREQLVATLAREQDSTPPDGRSRSEDAETVLDALARRVTTARNLRAEKRLRLDEIERVALDLPGSIRDDIDAVQGALAGRRMDRAGLEQRRRSVESALADSRPSRGAVAIEDEMGELRRSLSEVEESIESFRAAYALLDEAQREFRDEDQQRLVDRISDHLERLSAGALGPLEAPQELGDATLRAFDRSVPLDYRPLSYGQFHLVLLAVRLGAADFLTRWGVRVPLIVDEPFANLDDHHAAAVWRQLSRVARERQVIVATQESSLLDRLRAAPDIRLG